MAIDNKALKGLKAMAKNSIQNIDLDSIKKKTAQTGELINQKAVEIKNAAIETKDDITDKLTELDRMLESSVTEYNDAYTLMNDKGLKLYVERCRSVDLVANVENIVNSIANTPKSFAAEFDEIRTNRNQFVGACEFADQELNAAREAATGASAGLAAGASVAFMAPTAAMWIATTFGTASTGAAISTLSGAAATNAALAWLGGGALAAGGKGIVAGKALLALAGPIGWTIAGATLLSSILIFTSKKAKLNKQKNEEIESVKNNIEIVKEMDAKINAILVETTSIREGLNKLTLDCMGMFGKDYLAMTNEEKQQLGALVNNTKALSVMFGKTVE